jgi:RNA polymerase sigma-70 factor (ECF subfamily)
MEYGRPGVLCSNGWVLGALLPGPSCFSRIHLLPDEAPAPIVACMGFAFWLSTRDRDDVDESSCSARYPQRVTPVEPSPSADSAEGQLVARIRSGDVAAFESMYRTHHPDLCDYATTVVRSRAIGDELVADVFFAIWQRRADWNPAHGIAAYLFRAVRNRATNARRGAAREEQRYRAATHDDADVIAPVDLETQDRDAILTQFLATLSTERRVLVQLRWGRGLSYPEIAERLGVSTAAIQMQMSRLLRVLRQRLPGDLR